MPTEIEYSRCVVRRLFSDVCFDLTHTREAIQIQASKKGYYLKNERAVDRSIDAVNTLRLYGVMTPTIEKMMYRRLAMLVDNNLAVLPEEKKV